MYDAPEASEKQELDDIDKEAAVEAALAAKLAAESAQPGGVDSGGVGSSKAKARKAPELSTIERRNWLIHLHFVRQEYETCRSLIKEQLTDTQGSCEYASYVQGLIFRQEGRILDSLECFKTCAQNDSRNKDYLKQIARTLLLLGRHAAAIDVFNEVTRVDKDDWEAHHWRAVTQYNTGDLQAAKEALKEALTSRRHEDSLQLLGKIYAQEQNFLQAIEAYKKCAEVSSQENPDLMTQLGLLYMKVGSDNQAFEVLGRALAFNPSHSGAILAAGAMMQRHGDYDVALSKYRVASQEWPDSPQLWNNIGMCFYGKKKYVAAISCLKRANYLAPLDYKILYNLGMVHITMNQHVSAFHFLNAAANLQPKNGAVYSAMAIALASVDDFENARKAYERAIELDTKDPSIPFNYAVLLHRQGDFKASSNMLELYYNRLQFVRDSKTGQIKLDSEIFEAADKLRGALVAEGMSMALRESAVKPPTSTQLQDRPRQGSARPRMFIGDMPAADDGEEERSSPKMETTEDGEVDSADNQQIEQESEQVAL